MPHDLDRQPHILTILENFRGLDPLRKLFWTELNYNRENLPLPYQDNNNDLISDPVLWATGGKDNAFHVIYAQLNIQHKRWLGEKTKFLRLFWESYQETGEGARSMMVSDYKSLF